MIPSHTLRKMRNMRHQSNSEPDGNPQPSPIVDPTPIFELSVAYWRSCVLFTAVDLGVFNALAGGGRDLENLCARLATPRRSMELLIDALVALRLLEKDANTITNSRLAADYLVPDSPAFLGDALQFHARAFGAWGDLSKTIRTGEPAVAANHILGSDPGATGNFVRAMHNRALGVARCLVELCDLSNTRRLLDLGGGPATYARLLVERHAELRVTVLDLPDVLDVASELIQDSPAKDRITLQPGDMWSAALGTGYDAVLLSGVLHRTEGDKTIALLKRAAAAVAPRGKVLISDLFTGGPTQSPVLPELFSLHMLLTADCGRSLPLSRMETMCTDAGLTLTAVTPLPAPLPHTLCTAVRQ